MLSLTSPRHTSTLPTPPVRFAQIAAIRQRLGEQVTSTQSDLQGRRNERLGSAREQSLAERPGSASNSCSFALTDVLVVC
jgi:hypothetical protein